MLYITICVIRQRYVRVVSLRYQIYLCHTVARVLQASGEKYHKSDSGYVFIKKDPRSVLYPWLRYFCIIYTHHRVPQKHTTGVIHVSPFKDQLYYIYTVVCYTYISYLLHGALLATSIERDKRFIDINLFVTSQYTTNYKNVSNENFSSYNWTICNAKNEIK